MDATLTVTAPQRYSVSPFTIVVDSNEQAGQYRFNGLVDDARNGGARIIPQIIHKPMYREGLADYSIDGLENRIQIERKTLSDFYGSITEGRDGFEQEIARLHQWCKVAYLLIEAEWSEILRGTERMRNNYDPSRVAKMAKTASRTHDSWTVKYPKVQWVTCVNREHAEAKCYRLLKMFWRKERAGNDKQK